MQKTVALGSECIQSGVNIRTDDDDDVMNSVFELMRSVDFSPHGIIKSEGLFSHDKTPEHPSEEKAVKAFLLQFQDQNPSEKESVLKRIQEWTSDVAEIIDREVLEPLFLLDTAKKVKILHRWDFPNANLGFPETGLCTKNLKNLILAMNDSVIGTIDDGSYSYNISNIKNVVQQLILFKTILPRVQPYYAIKCCPDPILVRVLAWLNTGFDCASWNEIQQVRSELSGLRQLVVSAKMAVDDTFQVDQQPENDDSVIALSDSETDESPHLEEKTFRRKRNSVPNASLFVPLFMKHILGVNYKQDIASKGMKDLMKGLEKGTGKDGLPGTSMEERKIVFAHPCKIRQHVKLALGANIGYTTLDNLMECQKLSQIQKETGKVMKVLIRIATHDENSNFSFSSKYGVQVDKINEIIHECVRSQLEIVGCSFHVGSGCAESKPYILALEDVSKIFHSVQTISHGTMRPNIVDIGGGFFGHSVESFFDVANAIRPVIDELFPESDGYRIIAEPGRFFAAKTLTLVTEAYSIREIPDSEKGGNINGIDGWIYLNDSMYHSFNNINFDHYKFNPIVVRTGDRNVGKYRYKVFGCTCDSLDVISNCWETDASFGERDIMFFENMGAYTMSCSTSFNGFDVTPCRYVWM